MYRHNAEGVDMYELLKTKFAEDVVVDKNDESLLRIINGDFPFKFMEGKAPSTQLVSGISLNCVNYEEAIRFWKKVGLVQTETENVFKCEGYNYFTLRF